MSKNDIGVSRTGSSFVGVQIQNTRFDKFIRNHGDNYLGMAQTLTEISKVADLFVSVANRIALPFFSPPPAMQLLTSRPSGKHYISDP